ncbi:glycine betaine/proline transport system substrate-binding protein [Nocardioides thalensis]|uniref:Glycine betaine/proline transport system substrate-binding protein n=1 Tax=Nocardioides thalensis TaxID=1914755 RepID=A0A853BZF0_9ACTN|nr:ABC transporter substrate-binding protein [Nocardioides thalensis]NYI99757.1 glycine betaine/proline transport system substrate-binding protein [Nocardioides thalensis]
MNAIPSARRPVRLRGARLAACALATALVTTGCASSEGDDDGFAADSAGGGTDSVVLAEQPWVDLQVENEIAVQILTEAGYDASIKKNLSVETAAAALTSSEIDAYLGNWWPSQEPTFGEAIDSGDVEVVSTIVTGTEFAPAVPGDIAEELGISSLADLDEHADAFGHKIYGIEAGTPGNETIQKAIDADAYGLGDWELVASGTPAMLAQVEKSHQAGDPVVFLAWSPHWMTVEFDTVFLEDPEGVWGGAGEIRTITRAGFADDNPEIAEFLGNLEFTTDEAGEFYYAHDKEGESVADIAAAWIEANPDRVAEFLDGVETPDGAAAAEAVAP